MDEKPTEIAISTGKRAERRVQRSKVILRRLRLREWLKDKIYVAPMPPEHKIGVLAKTGTPCSCQGCGNPRTKYKGKARFSFTKQERAELERCRADKRFREDPTIH